METVDNKKLEFDINGKNILKFALPTIISMVIMNVFGTIDGIFVSRFLDVMSLSAVNIAMPILTSTLAVGMMIATGGSALAARKKGEGKIEEARENFTLLIVFSTVISLLASFLVFIFLDDLLYYVLGADAYLLPLAREYITPIVIGMPAALIGFVLAKFLIVDGKPTLAMIVTSVGGILSVALNFILLGVLELGLFAAGLGSAIGYLAPTVVGLTYFTFKKKEGLYFVKLKWDGGAIVKSMTSGVSEFITMFAITVTSTVINNVVMEIGGFEGVAAVGIMIGAQGIISSIFVGYAFGVAPIVSYRHGQKDHASIQKLYKLSLKIIAFLSIGAIAMGFVLAGPLTLIYVPSGTAVYDMAVHGIRIVSFGFVLLAFNIFGTAFFTAFEDGWVSGMMSFFRSLVFLVISLLTIPALLGNMTGVWLAMPVAELLSIFMTIYYLKKMKSKYHYA